MKVASMASRSWYYFRVGYNTYLVFMIGYGSTLVTIYYLAARNIPQVGALFGTFWSFALVMTAVGAPVSVLVGWVHTKKSSLLKAEFDIATEANPYSYRLPPGFWKEAAFPAYLETLRLLRKMSERANLLTPEEIVEIEELERKFKGLLDGGYLGVPRRKLNF